MKNLNIIRKSVIGAFVTFVTLTMTLTGCYQNYEMDLPLAVTSRDLNLTKEAGSTHVLVYADGEWTARLTRPVKWASLDRTSGYGNHEIVFSYSANYGISRKIGVIFQKGALADTVMFKQAGSLSDGQLSFTSGALSLVRSAADAFAPISTNLPYALDAVNAEIVYYDENGLANDPLPVEMTRQDENGEEIEGEEGEGEGEEGEGEPEVPVANPVDPWITDLVLTKDGLAFKVSANEGTLPRIADIKLSIENADGETFSTEVSIMQGLSDPMFTLESAAGEYRRVAQSVLVPTTDNNLAAYAPYFVYEVVYDVEVAEGEEWIRNLSVTSDGLTFNLTENETGAPRTATINLSYTDALGNSVAATHRVTQKFQDIIDELHEMEPGVIAIDGELEGFIIGDFNSKNNAGNTFIEGDNKYDRTVNDRTNYVQTKDGMAGFMLVFDNAEDNNIPRYTPVKISVKGLNLVKNADPAYYVLTGLTASNVKTTGIADEDKVPAKEKSVAELTDEDIFTMVTLKGLEIMCKDGAYTNLHEGYTWRDMTLNLIGASSNSRTDQGSLRMYDREGNSIMMLTNILAPWRRTGTDVAFGTVVPQGSGDFKGIIVHDETAKIDLGAEYMGRYQIRALVEEDIALDEEAAFTKTLVEWTWNDGVNDLKPEVGSGEINHSGASASAYYDFNNPFLPVDNNALNGIPGKPNNGEKNSKGMVKQGAQRFYNLWQNAGKVFEVSFSTANASGSNMMFGMTWMSGNLSLTTAQVPYEWELSYSIDGGSSFTTLSKVYCRTTGVYSGCPIDAAPQYSELFQKLPAECFGQSKVIVRLTPVAGSKTTNKTASSAATFLTYFCQGTGTLTETNKDNERLCVGTITVRYN